VQPTRNRTTLYRSLDPNPIRLHWLCFRPSAARYRPRAQAVTGEVGTIKLMMARGSGDQGSKTPGARAMGGESSRIEVERLDITLHDDRAAFLRGSFRQDFGRAGSSPPEERAAGDLRSRPLRIHLPTTGQVACSRPCGISRSTRAQALSRIESGMILNAIRHSFRSRGCWGHLKKRKFRNGLPPSTPCRFPGALRR